MDVIVLWAISGTGWATVVKEGYIAYDIHRVIVCYARRNNVQRKLAAVWQHHGMASIAATVKTSHNVAFLCEHIDYTAFAFVASLLSKHTDNFHLFIVPVLAAYYNPRTFGPHVRKYKVIPINLSAPGRYPT